MTKTVLEVGRSKIALKQLQDEYHAKVAALNTKLLNDAALAAFPGIVRALKGVSGEITESHKHMGSFSLAEDEVLVELNKMLGATLKTINIIETLPNNNLLLAPETASQFESSLKEAQSAALTLEDARRAQNKTNRHLYSAVANFTSVAIGIAVGIITWNPMSGLLTGFASAILFSIFEPKVREEDRLTSKAYQLSHACFKSTLFVPQKPKAPVVEDKAVGYESKIYPSLKA